MDIIPISEMRRHLSSEEVELRKQPKIVVDGFNQSANIRHEVLLPSNYGKYSVPYVNNKSYKNVLPTLNTQLYIPMPFYLSGYFVSLT